MDALPHSPEDLKRIYATRFRGNAEYRQKVWRVLCSYFSQWIPAAATVLDLGCGHCEFINNVTCERKFGMDLNPDAAAVAAPDVQVLLQDCSAPWEVPTERLDVVFTSNFFEHLPTKNALERTLQEAYKALSPGGRLIAMGPNVKHVPGAYWDFMDHYLPLTDKSMSEVLRKTGFEIEVAKSRFLPYTMSEGRGYPIWMLQTYLALPIAWHFFGKQFLLVASKPVR